MIVKCPCCHVEFDLNSNNEATVVDPIEVVLLLQEQNIELGEGGE